MKNNSLMEISLIFQLCEKLVLFMFKYQCEETAFNPTTEPIKVTIKKILQKLTGSLKKKIPIKTVPTAPIPVHTA